MSQTPLNASNPNEIVTDERSREIKATAMHNMRNQTFLNSISKVATFIGAPLLASGLGLAATTIFKGGLTWAGMHAGLMTLVTGSAGAAAATTATAGAATTAGAAGLVPAVIAAVQALSAAAAPAALGIIVAGALFVGVAIATDYVSSRIYQACQFDNLEFNADSTARHLVKELKANNMCLTNEQATGACEQKKNWVASVGGAKPQQQAEWAVRVEAGQQAAATTGRA